MHTHLLAGIEGLVLGQDVELDSDPGLKVIVGANNSGKTRLLKEMSTARVRVDIRREALGKALRAVSPPDGVIRFLSRVVVSREDDDVSYLFGNEEDVPFQMAFTGHGYGHEQIKQARETLSLFMTDKGLFPRNAVYVSSDRFFEPSFVTASLQKTAPLAGPDTWAQTILQLSSSNDTHQNSLFRQLNAELREISNGLTVATTLDENKYTVRIVDSLGHRRALEDCGDGLRDLIGLLLHLIIYPTADLYVDEPGLRLHPEAQRRLLRTLYLESRFRSIWFATHDPVLAGAAAVGTRVAIERVKNTKDEPRFESVVKQAATRKELFELRHSMGWRPEDAFLANAVLLCEGESDRIAFQAALDSLAIRDPTFGGVALVDMGGSGAVWGANKKPLQGYLNIAKRLSPTSAVFALLDDDAQPEDKREELAAMLEGLDIAVAWLSGEDTHDLERIWTAQGFLGPFLSALGENATAEGKSVSQFREDAQERILKKRQTASGFTSECKYAGFSFRKPAAARLAVALAHENHPAVIWRLEEEVCAALRRKMPPRGVASTTPAPLDKA